MGRSIINTVKHWRKSNLRSWPKQPSFREKLKYYVPTMIFVSWLGTYLDLIFVEKQLYSFPVRPFSDIFKINIMFTLCILPIVTAIFLHCLQSMNSWQRKGLILFSGIIAAGIEQISEQLGWFAHSSEWQHFYSFIGYILFMWLVWKFHLWIIHLSEEAP
ncbi:CBO0543 family protein [Brevibacillus laterosporus]|uniref:CBO0543 family protein n=1 Tax=Brevibacillus laterosporus TaxID=1465 RepID=UPI00055366B7